MIPSKTVLSLPHFGGEGCYALNIVPTDYVNGKLIDPGAGGLQSAAELDAGPPGIGTWTP